MGYGLGAALDDMNQIYESHFPSGKFPARTTLCVHALHGGIFWLKSSARLCCPSPPRPSRGPPSCAEGGRHYNRLPGLLRAITTGLPLHRPNNITLPRTDCRADEFHSFWLGYTAAPATRSWASSGRGAVAAATTLARAKASSSARPSASDTRARPWSI